MNDLIDVSRRLAETLRELAMVRSAYCLARRDAWVNSADMSITERREHVVASCADLQSEIHLLDGEVDALRVERETARFIAADAAAHDFINSTNA